MHRELYANLKPAIGATYRGQRYRTRSEAKWAIVFTQLDIPFYYQPSHYRLASGTYQPDFWLPSIESYVEVKPQNVQDPRYTELGEMQGKRVFLVAADIPFIPQSWLESDIYPALKDHIWLKWPDEQGNFMLAREAQGRYNFVPIALASSARGNDRRILSAYLTASTYRF